MTKEELKTAVALKVLERARESAEREQNWQEWLQREREKAFKRNPRLLLILPLDAHCGPSRQRTANPRAFLASWRPRGAGSPPNQ
jgi:hypothetical protein